MYLSSLNYVIQDHESPFKHLSKNWKPALKNNTHTNLENDKTDSLVAYLWY